MEKKFSKIEINVIKQTAKTLEKHMNNLQKVENQIKEVEKKVEEQVRERVEKKTKKLESLKKDYLFIIDSMNNPIKNITGGYGADELVILKKVGTGVMDSKSGKEIMKTVPDLKYPDTVIPPTELQSEEAPEVIVPPTTADGPGSDFDLDRDNAMAEGFNPWDN